VEDRAVVERQIGRRPRAFRRVAARCPFGAPAVTEQQPYDASGAPFPTTYYLTCPHLVAAVSRLEAAGGVERWSAAVAASPELRDDLEAATATQRRIRRSLAGPERGADGGASLDWGIGGSRNPGRLKCLHAHVGFALANPGYRVGESILAEIAEPWPHGHCCSAAVEPA
jgi:uncharacterized protein